MTQVKICGITNIDDAFAAADAGADLIGFIFHRPSPRYIEPVRAAEIVGSFSASSAGVRFVGVFVNQPPNGVADIARACSLDLVQFSGDEPLDIVDEFAGKAYKSLRPRDADHARSLMASYISKPINGVPEFLVDAFNSRLYGGTGERADWGIAREIARRHRILLAGGLSAENVGEAVRLVNPWGVDVSSGVERAPGLKDHSQVKQFIDVAKKSVGIPV